MDSESKPPEPSPDSASLVRRLAGPSTTKAGLALDQTEINRIIAEASKGSKFYENEKKKDKDLTERIARILRYRDEAVKEVDIQQVEHAVDHLLVELESQRDLSQIIVHVDMDAFYANVELLHNPDLLGKPFGVSKGVLSTASYEARKYGVRSGMPGFIAKKLCPELIFVETNFPRYTEMSKKVMDIFRRYDPNMHAAGCDEGYLNITTYCEEHVLSPDDCVREMREKVREETKLTVSAGIAPNKMLAKICSDKNKPNGQFHLPFDRKEIIAFMHDLSIRKVQGVGRVNERLLESIGIKTCGDIYTHRVTLSLMDKHFGLKFLLRTHLGIASNVVQPGQREERKSIGAERTFRPLGDKAKIFEKLEEVAAELESDMERSGWTGRTVTLKFKLDTYQVFTRAKSFDRWITKKEELLATGKELLMPEFPLKLRLIGLRMTKLKDLKGPASTNGIKRFFESVNKGTSDGSPSKKRRLEYDGEVVPTVDDGQDEEVMPGFHEHADDDEIIDVDESDDEGDEEGPGYDPQPKPRPPVSAPARPSSTKPTSSTTRSKPRSTSHASRPPERNTEAIAAETHECPICGKAIDTDNQGLNAHIDFCLSRAAIREAQAQASSPKRAGGGDAWWGKGKAGEGAGGKGKGVSNSK